MDAQTKPVKVQLVSCHMGEKSLQNSAKSQVMIYITVAPLVS